MARYAATIGGGDHGMDALGREKSLLTMEAYRTIIISKQPLLAFILVLLYTLVALIRLRCSSALHSTCSIAPHWSSSAPCPCFSLSSLGWRREKNSEEKTTGDVQEVEGAEVDFFSWAVERVGARERRRGRGETRKTTLR
uniref:Uncharacterized protein n=1 Tax=Ananas comosus var. bracteatus TaxID=296719 RepID=A0A6V7NW20_ANACO|nr:unnamed protein product [Ananas comosus var. bracteatus]